MKNWASIGRIATATLALAAFGLSSRAEAAVGRTVGADGVSPSGAETYTIPIFAPRGPNGLGPHMALVYNSQQPSGYLGVGWSLAGFSAISRCNRTVAQDGAAAPVALTTADAFCLDGARLRLTGGTYGIAGSTYQTEVANFEQVTAYGAAGNGPEYFIVQARNGTKYEYGNGGGSQALANGTTTALAWYLDKVTDTAGNTMTLAYSSAGLGSVVPSTVSWTPVSYGASTYNYTMQFAYGTNSAAGSYYGYVGGTQVTNTQLLQSISIDYQGTTVKQYVLTHQLSASTGAELLTSVEECADAAESNCLAPTTFGYQGPPVGASSTAANATTGAAPYAVWNYDFNGDGQEDLAYCSGSPSFTFEVAFASPSGGYDAPINTGISCTAGSSVLYGDFLGVGEDGILAPNGSTWYYYQWNGSSFAGQSTGLAYEPATYVAADVDGDGRLDLIELTESPSSAPTNITIYARLNTSSASTVSFASTNAAWYSVSASGASGIQFNYAELQSGSNGQYGVLQSGNVRRLDFNGDGRDDLALEYQTVYCVTFGGVRTCHYVDSTNELVSTGSGFAGTSIASQSTAAPPMVAFLNFNSDACTDYLSQSTIYVSGCNGTPASTVAVPSSSVVGVMDWNADGRGDILVNNGGTIGVYESTGTGLGSLIATSIPYSSQNQYFGFQAAGDHLDALGVWQLNASPFAISYYPHNGAGLPPDLITSITDGYGNSVSPSYVSILKGAYSDYTYASPVYPYAAYRAPLYVVSKVIYSDPTNPPNGTYSKSYSYIGAWANVQGRGFSNFINVEMQDSRNGVWQLDCYENKFPFSGTHVCTRLSLDQAGNQLIRYRFGNHALITLDGTANNERYFIYQNQWTDQIYQVSWFPSGGSSTGAMLESDATTFVYDNYGNATSDKDPGSPYDGVSWTTTITNTPDVDTRSWCLPLLNESQVSYTASDGSPSVTRTKQFTPDTTNCRYNQITTEPSSSTYEVNEALGYDSFGNINSDTVTGIGMPARETTASWGATGQFPMSGTDASGATAQLNYDFSYGLVSSETDPNALTTSWQYSDGFGRVTKETRPDGTTTQWTYKSCTASNYCPGSSKMLIQETLYDTSGNYISDVQSYPDAADHMIQQFSRTLNASGSYYNFEQWQYDALGRLVGHLLPCLTAVCNTADQVTYAYDVTNRITQVQRPVSDSNSAAAVTGYAYAGDTTTITDANNNARTLVHDPNGLLRRVQDATGYAITLSYDAAGAHTGTVDSAGNPLWSGTVQYGIAPFTTGVTDADLGPWHYTFDALGELTAWSDAKGQSFSARYDALSRMTDRYEPDLYSHWTWGTSAAAHEIGRLHSVCTGTGVNPTVCNATSGYAESETYDNDGRPSQRSIVIPGDTTYTYTWSYATATGLLDTLTYPADPSGYRLQVKYGYAYGSLQSLTDISDSPNVTFWTGNSVDGRNQYTQETLGNGVVVNHNFDTVTGVVNSITAGPGGNATLQNNSYLYDGVGNVIQRQDNNAGITESIYYDALNRLSHTVGDTSTQLTYDTMGRLATWEASGASANVNDYTTPQSGCTYYSNAQPHALRGSHQGSWPPGSHCYDANGNLTSQISSGSIDQSVTWMSFNQPSTITAPAYNSSSRLFYDQNHQRYEQVASYSGSLESTEYIGGLLERMSNSSGTSYRYYVPAGNNFIVYNRWLNGTDVIDYATKDNLGSTAVVTDKSGALVANLRYSALGWGENTSAQMSAMAGITRHRFTGQEGLDNAGIGAVNMNGRLYIPSGTRFISPDPNIPDPTDTASYNRYAYVRDNPLTRIDPTGYKDQAACGSENCVSDGNGGSGGGDPSVPGWTDLNYTFTANFADDEGGSQPQSAPDGQLAQVTVTSSGISGGGFASFVQWQSAQLQQAWNSSPFGGVEGGIGQQSSWQKVKNWLCKDSADSPSRADTAGDMGTAADNGGNAAAYVGGATVTSRSNPYGAADSFMASQLAGALELAGKVGQGAASFSILGNLLSGNYQGALYGTVDAAVYGGLSWAGAVTALPTLGAGMGISLTTQGAYYLNGGSQGLVHSTLCN